MFLSFGHISFFFFNDTATTEIYTTRHTLSLHDALPICCFTPASPSVGSFSMPSTQAHRSEEHTSELQSRLVISYAVFCLKKKKYIYKSTIPMVYLKASSPLFRSLSF